MSHPSYCTFHACQRTVCCCPTSDEALATLRKKLAGEPEREFPVVLTVFTAEGTVTVDNIREDSIKHENGTLTCEADDGSSKCPLYTFFRVQGYSTTFA